MKTEKKHIVRAVMEAICFQNERLFRCIQEDLALDHNPCKSLNVDGGVTNSDTCMQFQADILRMDIKRPAMTECTALGAALAAGLGCGVWWKNKQDMLDHIQNTAGHHVFLPLMGDIDRSHRIHWWNKAIEKSLDWDYHKNSSSESSVINDSDGGKDIKRKRSSISEL